MKTLFAILAVANFTLTLCLIHERTGRLEQEALEQATRTQFESFLRTKGRGIDSAYICKVKP